MLTRIAPVAAAAGLALALAGCTASPPTAQSTSSAPVSGASGSASVFTAQGTTLALGSSAVVDYKPDGARETTLKITVSKVTLAPLKDFVLYNLSAADRKSNFYYVEMTIDNTGSGTVGGDQVPVWGVSPSDVLLPPVSFTKKFKPCTSVPLPQSFAPGDSKTFCEVYQVKKSGQLKAMSYRPDQAFNPIVWSPITLSKS